jgi:long-chain acyl-CoA synthetase
MTTATDLPTIPEMFTATVERFAERQALGILRDGQLRWHTWGELAADVQGLAGTLAEWGILPGDRVAQWVPNSCDWIVADLAILSLGAVHVPLHTSLSAEQAAAQIRQSGARLLFQAEELPNLAALLPPGFPVTPRSAMKGSGRHCDSPAESFGSPRRLACGEVQGSGKKQCSSTSPIPQSARSLPAVVGNPQSLATILFTSGTTGQPRGVMLSHANLVSNTHAMIAGVGSTDDEVRLGVLPLSHVFARNSDLYCWIMQGSRLALVEGRDTFLRDCQLVQPTLITGVPYLYEKVAEQAQAAAHGDRPGTVQRLLGGRIRSCLCGGAAASPKLEEFFLRQGLPLMPGYGLTETSPVLSATHHGNYVPGTVGQPVPGIEVRLTADREIVVRGPCVMQGYWQDESATQAAIVDGWFHTGDLGHFTPDGNLRIVGRLKELIVLSTGKKVSPLAVERRLTGSPLIEQACVVGEGQRKLGALLVSRLEELQLRLCTSGLDERLPMSDACVRALYRAELDRLTGDLSQDEQVGHFALLARPFLQEQGEITSKCSLCREVIAEHFASEIAAMYGDA